MRLKKTYLLQILWVVFLLFNALNSFAQLKKKYWSEIRKKNIQNFTVNQDEELVLDQNFVHLEQLTVLGKLSFDTDLDITLQLKKLIVNGGIVQAGSPEHAYRRRLNILLFQKRPKEPGKVWVKNGGMLLLYGVPFRQNLLAEVKDPFNSEVSRQLDRNIRIGTKNRNSNALVQIDKARKIELNGVQFKNLGVSGSAPAMFWHGTTPTGGNLNNSVFVNSKHHDLYLDQTDSVRVSHSIFASTSGSSIICSPSGKGAFNIFLSNHIFNRSQRLNYAVLMKNPYQRFENNFIRVWKETNGVGIFDAPQGSETGGLTAANRPAFHANRITRESAAPPKMTNAERTVGLYVDRFVHNRLWEFRDNSISHFDIGLHNNSPKIVFEDHLLSKNSIGLIPGAGYFKKLIVDGPPARSRSGYTGVWITDRFARSAPRLSEVTITNYPFGITIEGNLDSNYFEKMVFHHTKNLYIKSLSEESRINDKDGSLMQYPREKRKSAPAGHHGHHPVAPQSSGSGVLFAENSILRTSASSPLKDQEHIFREESSKIGSLTIATGTGLQDPIHEHNLRFGNILLRNTDTGIQKRLAAAGNREAFSLAANTFYEFDYGIPGHPLYDLSFEWEGAPKTWILIKLPYVHQGARGLRAFGHLLPESRSLELLKKTALTSYYIDPKNKMAYLKLYNKGHLDEAVIYSSEVLTEIKIKGQKVPLKLNTDPVSKEIEISYRLPEGIDSKLVLADYYGNPVETLVQGPQPNSEISVRLDMEKYDLRNSLYHYFLTAEGQTHKGPIYPY